MNCAALWSACLVVASIPAMTGCGDEPVIDETATALLKAHNAERAEAKLAPMTLDDLLTKAARGHAQDMAERRKMSHEGGDGSSPFDRIKREGYHYLKSGENVAAGQRNVASVMRSWMDSPGHKKNILGEFTQMGAAQAKDDDGEPYWCVVFGTPIPKLDPDEASKEAFEKLNAARKEAGKDPFKLDPKVAGIARKLAVSAAESAGKPAEEKKTPDLGAMFQEAGVSFKNLTENLAVGEPTAEELVKAILKDEARKEVVMGPFGFVGIGYAQGDDGTPFWCLLLVEE
ncbi:CAP domain-containing protein [Paludisphaera mucosa]|uniref:CAP domain-containing protein n=1 Tax=Paludisphaera mucosa TaxID=3030827 RepID=A0ABT6FFU5_9BACT|nr:CAP domain-containing protein [Paludisphaera mucosa]MDG3006268.1 CAP domain-containing protein [Paludisphaera mucosa]